MAMSSRPQWDQILQTCEAPATDEAPPQRTEPPADLSEDADQGGPRDTPHPSWLDDEPIEVPVPGPARSRWSRGRSTAKGKDSAAVLTDSPGVDSDAPPLPDFLKD
jgi:hypothetical protein